MSEHVENVVLNYLSARDSEVSEGMVWYVNANALALELSPNDVWRGAGVIAALSPFKEWKDNVRLARNAFATGIASGNMGVHNGIAQRILDGEHPLEVMRGDKTRNFTAAIALSGNHPIATIDRHAHDIAFNRIFTDKERKINKSLYRELAGAYDEASDLVGCTVNQLQAITWVAWKRRKGHK